MEQEAVNKAIEIIPLNECFRPEVNRLVASEWAGPIVVTKGKAKDSSKAEGFVACADGRLKGYILYLIEDGRCEILVRRIKPSVPLAGIDGIPLKHEMVFEYMLDGWE